MHTEIISNNYDKSFWDKNILRKDVCKIFQPILLSSWGIVLGLGGRLKRFRFIKVGLHHGLLPVIFLKCLEQLPTAPSGNAKIARSL